MSAKDLLAFVGGITLGAAVALLLAPTSGAELRSNIALKAEEVKALVAAKLKEKGVSQEKIDELLAKLKEKFNACTSMDDVNQAVEDVLAEEVAEKA